jgi:leukotriene-A4 hydrolase
MKQDPHTHAVPSEAVVRHLAWKAEVDFENRILTAKASWHIEAPGNSGKIILDVKNLVIEEVCCDNHGRTKFTLGMHDPILGQALVIAITPQTKIIHIRYKTSAEAEALQWLSPRQTAGKKFPFLFTQSQAILARSWVPCQDSPSVRFTYSADVKVPRGLLPLMSAENPQETNVTGEYHFEMQQPIPSYLLALAVGDVAFTPTSDRSGVYAERALIKKAAWEFADLEKMITAAEQLYGPYRWGRYDVLVLPPSFPFGGMENPRLTFATPTILAGDRSLTSLIAHELAHSWSGNLVTNATWNDFWLNEGFTVYFETRIMEKLYGKAYADMLSALNMGDLHEEIESLNEKAQSADTRLKLNLEGRNPDEGVTSIAYYKGYFFLRTIEEKYGREKFDSFLADYFHGNAFQSIDTENFKQYIRKYYQSRFNITLEEKLFIEWIDTEGLPENVPQPVSTRFQTVDHTLARWRTERQFDKDTSRNWSTHEWLHFLKNLPEELSDRDLETLDDIGNFSASGNAEIIAVWGVTALRHGYKSMTPRLEEFLINTGRRKFLTPLYSEMMKTPEGKERARAIYRKARPNYHFVATNTFDKLIGI